VKVRKPIAININIKPELCKTKTFE